MPNTIQLFPQNNKVTSDPTRTLLNNGSNQQIQNIIGSGIPEIVQTTEELIAGTVNALLNGIDEVTGLDLLAFAQLLESLLGIDPSTGVPGTGGSTSSGLLTGLIGYVAPTTTSSGPNVFSVLTTGLVGAAELPVEALLGFLAPATDAVSSVLTPIINTILAGLGLLPASGATSGSLNDLAAGTGTVITNQTPLPLNLIGNFHPTIGSQNLIPGGSFDTSPVLSGQTVWTWDANVGHDAPGSVSTVADGTVHELDTVPVTVAAGQGLDASVWVQWKNVTAAAGQAFTLAIRTFNAAGTQIDSFGFGSISNASANSVWTQIPTNTYVVPTGGATVRLVLQVGAVVTAGTVWFDDASLTVDQMIDASLLGNVSNIPQLEHGSVAGVAGTTGIGASVQSTWDSLYSAFTQTPGTGLPYALGFAVVRDVSLADIATAAQNTASAATNALTLGQQSSNTLAIRTNSPAGTGLESTQVSNFDLPYLGVSGTPTSFPVTQSTAAMGFIRMPRADTKGSVQWFGSGNTNITNFYVNIYKMDPATGNLNLLTSSTDLHTQLTPSFSWMTYVLPTVNDFAVLPGDIIGVEFQVIGPGTYTIAGLPLSWLTNHPTANLKQMAAVRNSGTSAAPATIPAASIGWSGNTPYVSLGITSFPANYHPPQFTQFAPAGTYTYNPPSWMVAGDFLDLIALGGGGGGGGSAIWTFGDGGAGGNWVTTTLVCGTDFPVGATTLTIVVGGAGYAGFYFLSGGTGGSTTITWTDPSSVQHTLTATGGLGGPTLGFDASGKSPGDIVFKTFTYFGGTNVGVDSVGSPPGGGGGGAFPYFGGAAGADGSAWLTARQH